MARFTVLFDRDARADLTEIRDHIAKARDAALAESFVERIIDYCESLATVPHRGARRDYVLPGLRTLGWRKTVTIAFHVSDETKHVFVLGVFYRGRDVLNALRERQL